MTFIAWFGLKLVRAHHLRDATIWTAIVLTAFVFGVVHLPQVAALYGLNGTRVAYVLLMNGAGGVVCGWLYWRRGLFAAIAAHICADLVLLCVTPFLKP